MIERRDVEFEVDGGTASEAGSLSWRKGSGPRPAISMAHGFAGVKEHGIARFAEAFADAGFVVLLHDHRTFGISGGEPRQDVRQRPP